MGSSQKDQSRSRRLTFDDHAGRFVIESRSDSVDRLSRRHERETETMNRGRSRNLDQQYRQVESDRDLFIMRFSRERDEARASLKDAIAYRSVLHKIVDTNKRYNVLDERLGSFGEENSYFDLQPLVEMQKKVMTAEFVRKRQADRLLRQRRPMTLMDRRQNTDALMRSWRHRSKSPDRRSRRRGSPSRGAVATKSLPPISVKTNDSGSERACVTGSGKSLPESGRGLPGDLNKQSADDVRSGKTDRTHVGKQTLPSIFLTDPATLTQ